MSAFQVTDKHIAYLVLAWNRYIAKPGSGEFLMSDDLDAMGRLFLYENRRSVATRYEGRHGTECEADKCPSCGEVVCLPRYEWRPRGDYRHRAGMPAPCPFACVKVSDYSSDQLGITPVGTLKAIDCYDYQASEHDGWEASQAKALIERLRGAVICALPGYEEAPWGIA